jgi:DNA-binding transcriptional LysR family regulator
MDVRLKHAVAVAKCGSFTAAAKLIGVTQSAVTRAVADLERQLGYDLFHRTARGAFLTDSGRSFADRAARLLDDERELLTGEARMGDPLAGVLRLGVSPAILEWAILEPITALKARHSGLRFEVFGSPFERMAPMLRNGSVDIVLGLNDAFSEWPDFSRHPLWELKAALFGRKDHPLFGDGPITRDRIARYEIVSPSESRPYGSLIRALYESREIEWRRRVHVVDYFPLVKRLVEKSDALGVATTSYMNTPAFQKKFRTVEGCSLWGPVQVCCATRARSELTPIARAFIAAMRSFEDPVHRPLVKTA